MQRTANLYRVDDVLLGGAKLTALLSPVALLALMQHAARAGAGGLPDLHVLGPIALATVLCPISLWLAGRHVRSAEKRVLALHELLQAKGEVHAASLIGDIGFTRAALKRAIRLLNDERLGYYTWDDRTDIIRDAHGTPPPSAHARAGSSGSDTRRAQRAFSLPVFAVLVVLCWPAAIAYAVVQSRAVASPGN